MWHIQRWYSHLKPITLKKKDSTPSTCVRKLPPIIYTKKNDTNVNKIHVNNRGRFMDEQICGRRLYISRPVILCFHVINFKLKDVLF